MLQTLLFAAGASLPLLVGGTLGAFWRPPQKLLAITLAFAAGALISAVAYDLVEQSYRDGGVWHASLGLAAGAIVFVVLDWLLGRWTSGGTAVGFALLAAVTLDGIPENVALGVSLANGGSIALLVAIFASNFPESLGGAARMRDNNHSRAVVIGVWAAATVLLGLAVVVGRAVFVGSSPEQLAVPLAFAGGAVLASVIDTVAPEAYAEGGPFVALGSVAGFFLAFMLSH